MSDPSTTPDPETGLPQSTATPEELEAEKASMENRYKIPPANQRTPADNAAELRETMAANKEQQAAVQQEADEAAAKLAPPPPAVTPPPQPGTEPPAEPPPA